MHRVPRHENESQECNAYCRGDIHADMIFLAKAYVEMSEEPLFARVRRDFVRRGMAAGCSPVDVKLLSLRAAPEGADASAHYPRSYKARPSATLPYLVTYRIISKEEGQ